MPSLVSVVLTTYNRPQFLPEAIDSILNQTRSDFELIVVDDGSETPETEKIVHRYIAIDKRVCYIKKENGGVSSARNAGVAKAGGKYIMFMCDDNIADSTRMEKQVNFLEQNPHVAAVGCGLVNIDKAGNVLRDAPVGKVLVQEKRPPIESAVARHKKILLASDAVIHREIYLEIGGCDERIRTLEDRDFTMKLEEKYAIAKIPDGVYLYRHHDDGNLCSHPMAWHYFCACYIMGYFRRKDIAIPDIPITQLFEYINKLPLQLRRACARSARGTTKRFMRAREYKHLYNLLLDFNMSFYGDKKLLAAGYLRMFVWSLYYGKVSALPIIAKAFIKLFNSGRPVYEK